MEANQHCYECPSMVWNGQLISLAVTRPVFSILSFPGCPAKPIPNPQFPIPKYNIGPCDPSFPGGHHFYSSYYYCYRYDREARAVLASPCFLTANPGVLPCHALSCSTNQGSVLTRCAPCPTEHHRMRQPGESIGNNMRMLSSPCAEIESREGPESINVSESGWTTYLDQSLCNSNSFTSDADMGTSKEEEEEEEKSVMADEDQDSSMASDASSGPQQQQQPLEFHGGSPSVEKMGNGRAAIDSRPAKRRRVGSEHEQNLCLLEDTASSPVCSSESGLTENKLRVKEILELSKGISDSREADAVNTRLDLLQSILPENTAAPLCREETLGVTMEYINSLEQRIKIYKEEPVEERSPNNAVLMFLPGKDPGAELGPCGALRKRGLCLVPLSTLWSSI